jgi:hypothetical protein
MFLMFPECDKIFPLDLIYVDQALTALRPRHYVLSMSQEA